MRNWRLIVKSVIKELPVVNEYRYKTFENRLLNSSMAEKMIEQFAPSITEGEKTALLQDMMQTAKKYKFAFDEYFLYDMENLTEEERKAFVPDFERIKITESLNKAGNQYIFDDKYETYRKFQKWYKRDVCISGGDEEKVFLDKHSKFIVKPEDGTCGKGVQIISHDGDAEGIIGSLRQQYGRKYVLEELIIQVDEMARFHPHSVNTVRIPTFRTKEGPVVAIPFMRVGRGNSVVDNAGAGGLIGALKMENGEVYAVADEKGNRYERHPDTGEKLIGFVVPHWKEALAMAKEMAEVVPGNRYTGWDMALTERGWVLVEANARGQFVTQIASQKGFRKELTEIMRNM